MCISIICPYCNVKLSEKPTRKKQCPSCQNYIFVRQGTLLTQKDAEIFDWLIRVEGFGVTKKMFIEHRDALAKQFGHQPSTNDIAWRILNSLMIKRPNEARLIYLEMGHIVQLEGKNPNEYIAQAHRVELQEYKRSFDVKEVKILTCNDESVCSGCRELEGQIWSVDEALEKQPIPQLCTKFDGCRCWYSPIIDYYSQ